jgi:hypothetical protein
VKRNLILALGIAATIAETALWHGPFGAGEELATKVERTASAGLVRLEMPMVNARLERGPLTRRLVLSGPADDFQQMELVRIMDEIPGVSGVRWANPPTPSSEAAR